MADRASSRHTDECPSCGTPIRHGLTTQYVTELDAEVCAVCENPLSSAESPPMKSVLRANE